MVASGNPLNIRTASDLAKGNIRLVNREPGAALRVLLDDCLAHAGVPTEAVNGYWYQATARARRWLCTSWRMPLWG